MSTGKAKGSGLDWFIRRGAAVRGPFSSARVRHFVLEGKLELTDEVSLDRHDWKPLGRVPEVVPLQMRDHDDSLDAQSADDGAVESGKAVRAMLIALAIIGVLTAGVYFASQRDAESERDCAAVPAPGINLEGCRLNGAVLTAVAMPDARLANAILAGARLSEAELSRADMRYADLNGADLSYARLNDAVLKGANLRLADLTNADLTGADLSFADLSSTQLGGARFDRANLEGAIWADGRRCGATDCPR